MARTSKDWSFATGNAEQISFVAGLMGLYYAPENGLISHDFRTALIGPDGTARAFVEEQRMDPLRSAAHGARNTDSSKVVASQ